MMTPINDGEASLVLTTRHDGERLYDPLLRRYITVEDLYAWQLMAVPITVRDAESGEDVTARVLDAPDQLH